MSALPGFSTADLADRRNRALRSFQLAPLTVEEVLTRSYPLAPMRDFATEERQRCLRRMQQRGLVGFLWRLWGFPRRRTA